MAAVAKRWREASSLILVTARQRDHVKPNLSSTVTPTDVFTAVSKGDDFEVLLMKRSAKSKFMPNFYVFPGGVASDADFSADWIPVFDLLGKDNRHDLFDFVTRGGQGSSMFSRQRDEQFSSIPTEIAFRICAIRETFEESGVLLASRPGKRRGLTPSLWNQETWATYIQDEASRAQWRSRVIGDPSEFLHMCQDLGAVPDVWALYEWSNWLTPLSMKQRFDTAFFICCVEGKPIVAADEKETVHFQVVSNKSGASPYQILHQYYQSRVDFAVPQLYEMGRLMDFSTVQDVLKFAWHRGKHRVKQWLSIWWNCLTALWLHCQIDVRDRESAQLYISGILGDSLYPQAVDPEGPPVTIIHNKTLAELDKSHPNKNRALYVPDRSGLQGKAHFRVICNIKLPGDHVAPSCADCKL